MARKLSPWIARRVAFGVAAMALFVGLAHAEELTRAVRVIGPDGGASSGEAKRKPPTKAPDAPRLTNSVDLNLEILPGAEAPVGTKMSFRVSAKKKGYVILVDVDADGKLTQIFPNFLTLAMADGRSVETNQIPPGKPVVIPQAGSKIYEFVASPPAGVGMTLAIFSETPLEMVDLPDVPPELAGKPEEAQFVRDAANSLKLAPVDASAGFQEPKFSYAAQFYVVR